MDSFFTTRQIADHISDSPLIDGAIREWQVRRLFEDSDLSEPGRFAGKRAISASDIPQIVAALRARGWLPAEHAEPAASH